MSDYWNPLGRDKNDHHYRAISKCIHNDPVFVNMVAWCRTCALPLSEPILAQFTGANASLDLDGSLAEMFVLRYISPTIWNFQQQRQKPHFPSIAHGSVTAMALSAMGDVLLMIRIRCDPTWNNSLRWIYNASMRHKYNGVRTATW